ncbi:hypothetical protein CRENBAI_013261, partial [Crenichthys baileyi]
PLACLVHYPKSHTEHLEQGYNRGDGSFQSNCGAHCEPVYKVEVDPGVESVLLPFKTTVRLPEGVTVKWTNSTGRMVDSQHWRYSNRIKMKRKLKSGDFSLTLKNPTDRDTDIYTVYNYSAIILTKKVLLNVKGTENCFTRVVETASLLGTFLEHRVRLQGSERKSNNAAIDFGSGYSGYAFNVRPREEGGGTQLKRWGDELGLDTPKTPTSILFDEHEKFLKFDYEAKTAYKKMGGEKAEKYYFIEDFKMTK